MKKYPPLVAQMPHMLHGGDYNPDQWIKWKDTIWKEDMRLAKEAGVNALSVGIFSWSMLEPEEGVYEFEWLDEVMDMLAENGLVAVLATPSGARPPWMAEKYPEVLRVTPDLHRNIYGQRHNHCLTSPIYREKVTAINAKLAERYKDHPALGLWHVSNEYGGECHCELCQAKFREYLKKRYGTLDALNESWWGGFWSHIITSWDQIHSPSPRGDMTVHGLNLDWKRFTTEQFVDFYQHEIQPLRQYTPDVNITTNLMGTYPGINYFRLSEVMDVVSWDNYPSWRNNAEDFDVACRIGFLHDLNRGLKDGRPFMMMESVPSRTNWQPIAKLLTPGMHENQSMQAIAHGCDTVQYFQYRKSRGSSEKFHGAVIDHDGGNRTRIFREVAETGADLARLDDVVGTGVPARVALLYDWENAWAVDDARFANNIDKQYEQVVLEQYRAFWKMGVPVDVVDETRDISKYDLFIAPMAYMLRPGFAEKVEAFTKAGGTFVATFITGYVDERDLTFLGGFPGPLKGVLGIWDEEIDALYPDQANQVTFDGKAYKATYYCSVIHSEGAQVLGHYDMDFYAGSPAVTVNTYGQGKAYYVAARCEEAFNDDFYGKLVRELGIPAVLKGGKPCGVEVNVRSDGEEDFVFLLNFTPEEKTVDVACGGVSLLSGEKVCGAVTLPGYGREIYRRPAQA